MLYFLFIFLLFLYARKTFINSEAFRNALMHRFQSLARFLSHNENCTPFPSEPNQCLLNQFFVTPDNYLFFHSGTSSICTLQLWLIPCAFCKNHCVCCCCFQFCPSGMLLENTKYASSKLYSKVSGINHPRLNFELFS